MAAGGEEEAEGNGTRARRWIGEKERWVRERWDREVGDRAPWRCRSLSLWRREGTREGEARVTKERGLASERIGLGLWKLVGAAGPWSRPRR